MFLRRFPQYLTIASLVLSLLLFLYSFFILPIFTDTANALFTAIFADTADAAEYGHVDLGMFFLSRTFPRSLWAVRPNEPISVLRNMHPLISITFANDLNTARRPDLHNSLSMVTFSSAVFKVRSKVEMDEMGNTDIQTPALNADDASMSSLSLVIPTQSTPNDFTSPTNASHGSTSFFPISHLSLRQPPKITRKIPHNQSVRVYPWFQQCFVSSNQPCHAKTFKVETQSTGAIASEQFSKKVQQYTSACQVQKAIKYLSPLGSSPTSRWTPLSSSFRRKWWDWTTLSRSGGMRSDISSTSTIGRRRPSGSSSRSLPSSLLGIFTSTYDSFIKVPTPKPVDLILPHQQPPPGKEDARKGEKCSCHSFIGLFKEILRLQLSLQSGIFQAAGLMPIDPAAEWLPTAPSTISLSGQPEGRGNRTKTPKTDSSGSHCERIEDEDKTGADARVYRFPVQRVVPPH
ncbi:hypothetical protein BLNAU_6160 [Blattamonas nauphoetae]|uniref:Uncharacterized protein n=1 Tax=Blattamonas nauphoetae TaxID=2049346 RepID=A0ABQ9Y592_9EUKA|nr:hypothetical protein BLNAU_6160 [Blattamonas nauphoetae]